MIVTSQPSSYIWLDGQITPFSSSPDFSLSHGMQYGSCVFEGIRSYRLTDNSFALFKGKEHFQRLERAAKFLGWADFPYSPDSLVEQTCQLIKLNQLKDCYVRPVVFLKNNNLKIATDTNFFSIVIFVMPWQNFFDRKRKISVSLCPDLGPSSMWREHKLSAHYAYTLPFQLRARNNGYDDILRYNKQGICYEFSGANLGYIKDDIIYLPKVESGLNGITKNAIIDICTSKGLNFCTKKQLSVKDISEIDALFSMGTATEICPISQVNSLNIKSRSHKVLQKIIKTYTKITTAIAH